MKTAMIVGLGLAGLAWWLGNRAAGAVTGTAYTPDGQDASRSFNAGIADENTIPTAMPVI